jgi:hypothetical protein
MMLVLLPYVAAVLLRPDTDAATRSEQRPALHAAHDWSGVAECESGGNWHDANGMFEGGLQFLQSTWLAEGGGQFADHAYDATRAEQIEVAERLYAVDGSAPWPTCGWRMAS